MELSKYLRKLHTCWKMMCRNQSDYFMLNYVLKTVERRGEMTKETTRGKSLHTKPTEEADLNL